MSEEIKAVDAEVVETGAELANSDEAALNKVVSEVEIVAEDAPAAEEVVAEEAPVESEEVVA